MNLNRALRARERCEHPESRRAVRAHAPQLYRYLARRAGRGVAEDVLTQTYAEIATALGIRWEPCVPACTGCVAD
ncbi:MAG: hypothetical protein KDB60_19560 [Propionibacteriaceae bacterium]|nr:hypothetical protein [Propionibacteriaceae bacterium]